jgi:flagellar assembly factor FliW
VENSELDFTKINSPDEGVISSPTLSFQQTLHPSVPNDVALSFYVHASKLILSVYHLGTNAATHQLEIMSRNQVKILTALTLNPTKPDCSANVNGLSIKDMYNTNQFYL